MSDSESQSTPAVYNTMFQGIDLARGALEEVKKRVIEFDSQHGLGVAEKASTFLGSAIQKAQESIGDLGQIAESLKAGPTEIPVKALTSAIAKVNTAFGHLSEVAHQYDEKFKLSTRLSTVVANPREQTTAALATIAAYGAAAAQAATAQLQGVSDGLRSKLLVACNAGVDKAMPAAVRADEILHVSTTGSMVLEKVKELDEKFGIAGYLGTATAPAQSLDQKVTGGKISQAITAAYNMGWNMVGSVQEKFEETKKEMNQP